MPPKSFTVSQKGRDQLVKLKRLTGLEHWNEISRWAFCVSLAEPNPPTKEVDSANSNIDIDWQVFGGAHHELYWALVKERCKRDGLEIDETTLGQQFRLHLHRGLSYLASDRDTKSIADLMRSLL
jgi:DNA sulfur modification protein DndE